MPIYEYRCEPCDHRFETLVRSASDVARCPRCGGLEVSKEFSVPAAAQSGQSSSSLPSLPACGGGGPGGMCGGGMCGMG